MSEFVECQNCGRTFLAENLDCPYCGGEDQEAGEADATMVTELMRKVAPNTPAPVARAPAGGLFDVLFVGFAVLVAAIAVWAAVGSIRAPTSSARSMLAFEAAFAIVTAAGVFGRRRWARGAAFAFIAWNVAIGVASLFAAGPRSFLGPTPAALLLFAWPFLSPQARERFTR